MSVSFAPVRSPDRLVAARLGRTTIPASPANDNGDDQADARVLDAALRHFAVHGLGAAVAACAEAEAHWQRGDRRAAENSLAICRTLDKRLARDLQMRLTGKLASTA
jgi:hypothetical protein